MLMRGKGILQARQSSWIASAYLFSAVRTSRRIAVPRGRSVVMTALGSSGFRPSSGGCDVDSTHGLWRCHPKRLLCPMKISGGGFVVIKREKLGTPDNRTNPFQFEQHSGRHLKAILPKVLLKHLE